MMKRASIYLLLFSIVAIFSRNFLTEGYLTGWDSMSHVFKTWFAMEWLKGRTGFDWCEYWYMGSPVMPMYGSLFYVLSGLFGNGLGISALTASKWVVFLSFPISALSFYHYTKSNPFDVASFTGAILYGLIPWHFTYTTIHGNPTYSLSYVFIPPLFKYISEKGYVPLVLASASLSLVALSHQGAGFLTAYSLIWYSLFSGILNHSIRESFSKLFKIGSMTLGFLCFFWLPYIYYSCITTSFKIPFSPRQEVFFQLFQENNYMYLGPVIFILSLTSVIIVILSKNKEGFLYSLMTGLLFLLTFSYNQPIIKIIYPFSEIFGNGYRFNILSSFMISMLLCEFIKSIPRILHKLNLIDSEVREEDLFLFYVLPLTIVILSAIFLNVFPISDFYNAPIPDSHGLIFSTISQEQGDWRVWWVPRGAFEASIPMFTGLATPDGWYDQAATLEVNSLIHDTADRQLFENPPLFVERSSELSVRFLIVTKGPAFDSLKDLEGIRLISDYPDLALFRVENIEPLKTAPQPAKGRLIRGIGVISSTIFAGVIFMYYRRHGKF